MASTDDGPARDEHEAARETPAREAAARQGTRPGPGGAKAGLWAGLRTGEWPRIKIDLSDAYEAVHRRGRQLRRRRIVTCLVAALVLAGTFTVIGVYYVGRIPLPDALSLPETTTVYYSDGRTVMARLGSANRTLVSLDRLPVHIGEAVVAAEDPGFWHGSTSVLSRQYARAATGLDQGSASGKLRLLVMTWKLEDTYSRRQILEFYLNTVYFGRGAYGIEAAAEAYFGKPAAGLTLAESIVLAGLLQSPGDGRYDPSIDVQAARIRFAAVADEMVNLGTLERATASELRMPITDPYDLTLFESALDRPTGLVVAQVLAELRSSPSFRDRGPHYIEEGGFRIVTTINRAAQDLLERNVDETVADSPMYGQPGNLQAAAALVAPGTGRVLAYYGGHNGTGADYAGWYIAESGAAVGYGAHPPGETFFPYVLATALDTGISVRSVWDSPLQQAFPSSGRGTDNPVRDYVPQPCQPHCTLAEAASGALKVPLFAVTEQVGPAKVIEMAHDAGIGAMWAQDSPEAAPRRYDLTAANITSLSPRPFGASVGIGQYPVTVLDQASAMATFAAQAVPSVTHFVQEVTKAASKVYAEPVVTGPPLLEPEQVAELGWALRRADTGQLADGRVSAAQAGASPVPGSPVENAHAWTIGYTPEAALAVWIGNKDTELPLRDKYGGRVTGDGLPAEIYRTVMSGAADALGLVPTALPEPAFVEPGGSQAAAGA